MSTWVALLRGVNVGGKNKLPMQALQQNLHDVGLQHVRTYIQSGNVVFDNAQHAAAELDRIIVDTIEHHHGFRPQVMLIEADHLKQIAAANPYPKATTQPKSLHLFFLTTSPAAENVAAARQLQATGEHMTLHNNTVFLHAPDGIGRSKLANSMEKVLGVSATARNWQTVQNILALVPQPAQAPDDS